uniref:Uncharacterized protein n=1 Tax=Globodera rostochiensis TaxID=31243 RepID=A0A914H9J1_GLORO
MEEFWILILVAFLVTNSLDKAESVQLEELEELTLQTFDELFVDKWWDKDEAEDLKTPAPTNFGRNVHHQIDRQNTQIGQIDPNSTDNAEDEKLAQAVGIEWLPSFLPLPLGAPRTAEVKTGWPVNTRPRLGPGRRGRKGTGTVEGECGLGRCLPVCPVITWFTNECSVVDDVRLAPGWEQVNLLLSSENDAKTFLEHV